MADFTERSHYVKYGAVRFTQKAEPEEINRFVRELPPEKKDSLYEVLRELESAGLITIHEEITPLHQSTYPMAEDPGENVYGE